jgi:hypothetical protein
MLNRSEPRAWHGRVPPMVAELGLIGILAAGPGHEVSAQVTAAVLM